MAWVEFVIGSCLYFNGLFLGPLVFLPPQKPTFQFNLETVDMESYLVESPMLETHYNYYYFFIIVVIKRDYCIGMNEEVLLSIFC